MPSLFLSFLILRFRIDFICFLFNFFFLLLSCLFQSCLLHFIFLFINIILYVLCLYYNLLILFIRYLKIEGKYCNSY